MIKDSTWNHIVAVTNRDLSARPYLKQIERICRKHPRAILIREKDMTAEEYAGLADASAQICRQYGVLCVYHSFVEEARCAGAGQIHLPLHLLRRYAGSPVLEGFDKIGASVHSAEEAREAEELGASVLTAGHIYVTDCKKGLAPRGMGFLRDVCRAVRIPVYAIGGIHTEEQIREVMAAGAAGACVMSEAMAVTV